jgi:hypothetical protein
MRGLLRYFLVNAQARTGVSAPVLIWGMLAALAALVAAVLFLLAAFIWLAERYSSLTASLVLGFAFLLLALTGLLACLLTRRRNIARARLEIAARKGVGFGLFDPKLLAMGFQIGQSLGWRKLVSLGAVALLAAGLAREWLGADQDKDSPGEP